jgi:putative heme-binding domain-containing protein
MIRLATYIVDSISSTPISRVRFGFTLVAIGVLSAFSMVLSEDRVPWTGSKFVGTPEPPRPFALERVYPKMEFKQPVELLRLGKSDRMLLLEVDGLIHTFADSQDCEKADVALNLKALNDKFTRSFAISIPPRFDENHEVYVVYGLNPIARPDGNRLSRFKMTMSEPPVIDPASEEILLTWASGGHSGSAIRFDRDGYLYFSAGDGARPFPPDEYNVGQDLADLRATICRIDINHRDEEKAYRIPPDNPFINTPNARPEIWAFGFRNPWRFSIDPLTQVLHCGDVGWELWEMVFQVERGANYGWSIFEGPQTIRSDVTPGPAPISKPLYAYPHTDGLSITGGFVYRGEILSELQGAYIYGDFVNGKIWGLRSENGKLTWHAEIADTGLPIITFSQDANGEMLVVGFNGEIHRLIRNRQPDLSENFPRQLSQTGLFREVQSTDPAPGVVPYRLQAHAYEGGATSTYLVGIPNDGAVELKQQKRQWIFPAGAVFAKTLSIASSQDASKNGSRKLETQVLHFDGTNWNPYSYIWREDQSDADLASSNGATITLGDSSKTWRVHSRAECLSCHSSPAGAIAGWDYSNLGGPAFQDPSKTQLDDLMQRGLAKGTIKPAWKQPTIVDPLDETASLEARARAYLAMNCSQCHCRGGGGTVALELPFSHKNEQLNALDQAPTQGTFGIENAKVIAKGDPYRSVLYYRMATNGAGHMPKLWPRENDSQGLKLVHDWIASLDSTIVPSNVTFPNPDEMLKIQPEGTFLSSEASRISVSDALRWFYKMEQSELEPLERKILVSTGKNSFNPVLRGLFERFVPPSERVKRLGNQIDAQAILAMKGDASKGFGRYLNNEGQCRLCHRVDGQGRSVGPDLDKLASKRSREELLESILEPSRRIEGAFIGHKILTTDGRTISGLLMERNDRQTIIRGADGIEHRIDHDDIEESKQLGISLMPTGLAAEMTADELADLLAFLESLK